MNIGWVEVLLKTKIDAGSLLSFCGIGFGLLITTFSILIQSEMGKTKETSHYFKAGIYNSVRSSQLTALILIVCCLLLLVGQNWKNDCWLFIISSWMALFAVTWVIISFSFYFLRSFTLRLQENREGSYLHKKYRKLNKPPLIVKQPRTKSQE